MSSCTDIALFMRSMKGGGAEKVMANLANGLARSGVKVDLVLMNATGQNLQHLDPKIRIVDLATSACDRVGPFKAVTSFQSLRSVAKLIDYLKSCSPSVLLSATHYLNELSIVAKHIARSKTRVIVSEHTNIEMEAQYARPRSAQFIPFTARLLYPFADGIVAVSHGVAQALVRSAQLSAKKIQVIYNPVIEPALLEQAQLPIDHPWFDREASVPIVVGSGRFSRQKDFPTLIEAFAELRQQRPARLVLLGDGSDRAELTALVSRLGLDADVWFPGFVTNPYAYMAKADVFVSSAAWEGLSMVLVEALALGIPVVSTDCPSGPSEVLQQGKYGHLVPVGDASAMSSAIEAVLEGDRRPATAEHLHQFTFSAATAQYLKVFRQYFSDASLPADPDLSSNQPARTKALV